MDQNLTPSDWMQLCRAVLSGGDYLIWRSDYQENCVETARRNVAAGHLNRSAGPCTPLNQQALYDPGVYAEIATTALRA